MNQKLAKIHAEALAEFAAIQSALREERQQCLQDRRFYSIAGAQWEGDLGTQFENKPKFEINKIALAVQRIFTEYRNNRISVSFNSKFGAKNDRTADICAGLYRADEQDSGAEEAYDNAFEEGVAGGFGAWRLRPDYEDPDDPEENTEQRIRIEPIFDADSSVFFDLQAKRQDKADATRCFVLTSMTKDAYVEEYGDDPTSWPKEVTQSEFDWATPDIVYVAEYYRVEKVNEKVITYKGPMDEIDYREDDLTDEVMTELSATGYVVTSTKEKKRRRVHMYVLSGGKILKDVGIIAGKHIPIVPFYGKRWFVDNVERCSGHVRLAKDAQRLKNMQISKLGELAALSSIEKPIFTPEQLMGHQQMWIDDNIKNYPYLLVNPVTGPDGNMQVTGPVAYTKPPAIPPAMAAILQISEQDIRDVLGNQEQADKIVSNISGVAVEMVQQRLDMQTFVYMSNMAKAIRRCGEIWLEMARDIYVEPGRKMKSVSVQGEVNAIEIARPVLDKETNETVYENDLSTAHMDVAVDVGPSFSSQRAAIVRALTTVLGMVTDPQDQQVLQSIILMNMDGEGLRDAREYFRKKLVGLGIVQPTEEEARQMEEAKRNAPEDPNAVFLRAAAEEATAKATKARAEVVKVVSDSELAKAKTVEILSSIDAKTRDQLITVLQMLIPEKQQAQLEVPPVGNIGAAPEGFAQAVGGIPGDVGGEFIERLSNQ